ncbi:MAG TPA: DUF2784 domain-containing protein [Flavitalea sp.]|nr:DUF2784 domain-containing protein [Flavitalea sp.]
MLRAADIFFTLLHLVVILFNLTGWIFRKTRKIHLITLGATTASWFILGIWFGIGYCPLTDWQWTIKRKLGETNLPASFIKYFADRFTGADLSPALVDTLTLVFFILAVVCTVYVNFLSRIFRSNVK